jgi:hypothetical protein
MSNVETGRLDKRYRIMWDQNSGQAGYYNPPMSPQQVAQAHFGFFAGRPVDAYVGAPGCNAGYTLAWPTEVENAEFMVDRLNSGALVGSVQLWRHAENLRRLWEDGHDPVGLEVAEAQRLGIDHWIRLSMNDWHHWGADNTEANLQSSRFYDQHPEYLIGQQGTQGWSGRLAEVLPFFQDFAHAEVRALRLDIAIEACSRYPITGFLYDYMRCPGYFKHGEEETGLEIMTQFMRDTRRALDRVGEERGQPVGLAVRVPTTIDGGKRLGLDVAAWIGEGLIDLVVPSCFFAQDMEEDVREWVELAHGTGVQIYASIEEAYRAGHTSGFRRWFFNPPVMTPLSNEMICGLAARHWQRGVDGIYVFNFFGTAPTYDYDNREALDDIGDPRRLEHKDKLYVVTRSHDSFPNCLQTQRQIPTPVSAEPVILTIDVPDDLQVAQDRLRTVSLWLHLDNLTVDDQLAVTLNGTPLDCANPMPPGGYDPTPDSWLRFDLMDELPAQGTNKITVCMVERNTRLADELAVELADVELEVRYAYPDGEWRRSPGWYPRT